MTYTIEEIKKMLFSAGPPVAGTPITRAQQELIYNSYKIISELVAEVENHKEQIEFFRKTIQSAVKEFLGHPEVVKLAEYFDL